MSANDYYKTLGVSKTASDAEIKKSYHKLALKYHPDRNKDDKNAEAKFKEISEAYAVLSDKEKKQQYDTYGSADFQQRYSQEDIFRNFDLGDILKEFGFGGGRAGSGFGRNFGGGGFSGTMGGTPFGHGMGGGCRGGNRPPQKGNDIEYNLPLNLEELMNGCKKTVTINHGGNSDTITVKIPRGMVSGKKIRVAGKGESNPYGGERGDLYIKSSIIPHPDYEIEGNDLTTVKSIKMTEALLGTRVDISTPLGKQIALNVAPGTRHKSKLRISNHGIPHMNGGTAGALYVIIHVEMPKKLSDKQKKLVEKLVQTGL